jgi:ketopantoate reductase
VLTLQNDVDSPGTLARLLGAAHVIGSVARITSVIAEPDVIHHTGTRARFALGELNGARSERVGALADALRTTVSIGRRRSTGWRGKAGVPTGNRTRVSALKGRCPNL